MNDKFHIIRMSILMVFALISLNFMGQDKNGKNQNSENMENKMIKSEDEWREILEPAQFYILREKGTEAPYTGEFYQHKEKGSYHCAACGNKLFTSDTKYASGCGWPSFYKAYEENSVIEKLDTSHGMVRTEILCAMCEGHLGHVFNDGPEPTGLRYCINSAALEFKAEDEKNEK